MRARARRFLAPEVVQTSAMDCGPAALKCLLEGFGVRASYGRLREVCRTDVDGTSIDVVEEVARELGLEAEQVLVPLDGIAAGDASLLPAIAVVHLPGGANNFIVVWRRLAGRLQVMDPGAGRRWVTAAALRREVVEHGMEVSEATWLAWARSEGFRAPLAARLARLGMPAAEARALIDAAAGRAGWRPLAALDAAERLARALRSSGALPRGRAAARIAAGAHAAALAEEEHGAEAIPAPYWDARPCAPRQDGERRLHVRGAVLVRVRGVREQAPARRGAAPAAGGHLDEGARPSGEAPLSHAEDKGDRGDLRGLARVLDAPPARPGLELLRRLADDGLLAPALLLPALALAALAVAVQGLAFGAFLGLGPALATFEQRAGALAALLAFLALSLALEWPITAVVLRLGRHMEGRARAALQAKLPRLLPRVFFSRPSSDLAERAHSLLHLRSVPTLASRAARAGFQLALTALGLAWLDPSSALPAAGAALVAVALPLGAQRMLGERELRARSHRGALGRFYLDALLGAVPVRTHGAERALAREHESLLVEWVRASRRLVSAGVLVEGAQLALGLGLAAGLVAGHAARGAEAGGMLLFAYWALALPALGEELAARALQVPALRNVTARALEPLGAPEEGEEAEPALARGERSLGARAHLDGPEAPASPIPRPLGAEERPGGSGGAGSEPALGTVPGAGLSASGALGLRAAGAGPLAGPPRTRGLRALPRADEAPRGVALELAGVHVHAGGRAILEDVSVHVAPGEHVAVVGPSGAGKTTLVGLFLGWQRPARGRLEVDGRALDHGALRALRRATAWVDPAVDLWNRSLFENLRYGAAPEGSEVARALADAELHAALERLPAGLATVLGEGGGLISGGEGQRVRFGRALARGGVRLALLDEPFRGLDRAARHVLLARARARWRAATLLCATHDLAETRAFDRVLVIEGGRLVEDGAPAELAARPSRYRALLEAEARMRAHAFAGAEWRRLSLADGRLREEPREAGA